MQQSVKFSFVKLFSCIQVFAVLVLLAAPAGAALAEENVPHGFPHALLYVTSSKASLDSLREHISSVDIIAPQTYAAKADGTLLGTPNTEILKLAADNGATLMPLVVNQNFDQKDMDSLLKSDAAENKLMTALIAEGKKQGYLGFQYDFEHIAAGDKDLYSAFVQKSAALFHTVGLELSVAVAPKRSDLIADYGLDTWNNWTGAYDYQAIGASADFISVMAYDDSESQGPVASFPWVQSVLTYTLARVPADKVSLGIAFYGWTRNNATGDIANVVTYPAVTDLMNNTKIKIISEGWSDDLGSSYLTYTKNKKSYTVWYEDEKSFQEKLGLVADDQLRGFSGWAIGEEDPTDWDTLIAMRAPDQNGALAFKQ